ncbi:MAG: hypothetical protein J3K34DRAFT_80260 [Monoraphidium minutum]|nr:MAG: hypothetical protein J3K34DRAFT_80260 [Monoraphidium minutum]
MMPQWSRAPLIGFDAYRQREREVRDAATTPQGALLEYETLALRVDPPNIAIDNESFSDCTRLTIDSANRPGASSCRM